MKKDIFESMYDACLLEFQEYAESLLGFEYSQLVLEATDNGRQLILEQLDEERFIKANDCKEITNPGVGILLLQMGYYHMTYLGLQWRNVLVSLLTLI